MGGGGERRRAGRVGCTGQHGVRLGAHYVVEILEE